MKKKFSFVLLFCLVCSFCACAAPMPAEPVITEEVKKAEAAITAIGSVSAESQEAIAVAENLFAVLTDQEKLLVSNRTDLAQAKVDYAARILEANAEVEPDIPEAVKRTEEAINAIGTVSVVSGDAITNADNLFSVLTDQEKALVSNRLDLAQAKIVYKDAIQQAQNAVAEMVEENQEDLLDFDSMNESRRIIIKKQLDPIISVQVKKSQYGYFALAFEKAAVSEVNSSAQYDAVRVAYRECYTDTFYEEQAAKTILPEEIDDVIATLEYIKENYSSYHPHTEVYFETKSGLQIGASCAYHDFGEEGTKIYVRFNTSTIVWMEMSNLTTLINALQNAQEIFK